MEHINESENEVKITDNQSNNQEHDYLHDAAPDSIINEENAEVTN